MKPKIESITQTSRGTEITIVAKAEAVRKLMSRYALTHSMPPAPFRFK